MMQLPPQAYTKETLIQAYNWLRTQPIPIQEMAKSPDALVSLFTKSQIHGENYLSRTNLQGFKSELKNLAHIMGDLDSSSTEQQSTKVSSSTATSKNPSTTASGAPSTLSMPNPGGGPGTNNNSHSPHNAMNSNPHQSSSMPPMVQEAPTQLPSAASPSYPLFNALMSHQPTLDPQDLRSLIDARSWGMLQEVKTHLNLSTETEALRLLISLGYQKIRPQF